MTRRSKTLALFALAGMALAPALSLFAQDAAPKKPAISEARAVEKIKEEGTKNSQVMNTLDHLTNVIGPRLTASPNMKKANNWTRDKLSEWGLKDAHLEAWGPFGKGWTLKRFTAQIVEPQCIPLIAHPKPWSKGLDGGPIVGEVVFFDAKTEADFDKYKGKLKNAILLMVPARDPAARFRAQGARLTDTELLDLADAPDPLARVVRRSFPRKITPPADAPGAAVSFIRKRSKFWMDEGVAAIAAPSRSGDGGTLFIDDVANTYRLPDTPATASNSIYAKDAAPSIPQFAMSLEHYNRLVRMIRQGEKPKMALDFTAEYHDDDLMGYNTVAEIPGTDLKDEIVMLGGHMDSWHSGTGATDNAAGVSACMEAVRILQAQKLQPRRTIRIALWSGEEQGLYGSQAYVKEHFGGYDVSADGYAASMYEAMFTGERLAPKFVPTKEHEKLSAYFNIDNGTGKIRGVYLEGNEAVRPIFKKWLEPFRDQAASTLSSSPTGGTDHMSFDAVGLPGFQFIQDPIEYETRTHHSNMDTYERIQPEDMKESSVIMATFIYNAAMRDEKLPRKPQPAR